MTLADERLKELDNPSFTPDEGALLRCRVAADLADAGKYEAAREALGELWRGTGERPAVEGLTERTAAEVLLQAGVISGWIGASKQFEGAQEASKDLISESAALFERLGEPDRAAAAGADLALCYWREGAYSEARAVLESAAALIKDDTQLKAKAALRFAVVESSAGRYGDALRLLTESAPLFGEGTSHTLRGSFHNELAIAFQLMAQAERRADYTDRAILEYTAAAFHFEQACHERYVARIENNLAFLFYKLGRHAEAHEHLDRARSIFARLRDQGSTAQVDETRARVLVAQGRYEEAERIVGAAIRTLEQGDQSALLADALIVQGVVRARLSFHESSVEVLRRAAQVAESVGATSNAGLAMLTLVEEHGASELLSPAEAYDAYLRADGLLKRTQDAEEIARLRACAQVVMCRLAKGPTRDKDFSLYAAVHEFEARLIKQALEEAGGSVTNAARLLGLSHQTLVSILSTRHRLLADKRKPPQKRMRSIIKKARKRPQEV